MTITEIKMMLKQGASLEAIHLAHGDTVGCPICQGMTKEEAQRIDMEMKNGDWKEV